MAWFQDQWIKIKDGARRAYAGARTQAAAIRWRKPPKSVLIWTGSIFGALLAAWVALNLLLANPSTGTPIINWALGAFGDRRARVETGRLAHAFSDRFVLRALNWPGAFKAHELDVSYDVLGFLPGRPWAKRIRVRDGEVRLPDQREDDAKTTFNPQHWVNEIDAANVDIRFTADKTKRTVRIVKAFGSFSDGSVSAEATSGRNRITFEGLQRDWGGALKGSVTASGDNLKDLAGIAGASAPDTPPFNVSGDLSVQSQTWSVEKLSGRVGDSDIGGLVRISLAQKKPMLTVDLKSDKLDFDDLGVVFGIPLGTGQGETENVEQARAKQVYDRSARLLPDARIDFSRLAAVNADMKFLASKVVDAPAGITSMSLDGTLRDSVLDFKRAYVKSGAGDLDARIRINAQSDPAVTRATGTLEQVAISKLIPTDLLRGSLNGKFALDLRGSGFREAAGSANGEIGLWSNNSELKKFATEGAGLDLGEILLLWAKDDADQYIKSRCLAANIALRSGQARLEPAVIENKDSLVVASGGVNLKNEAVDIQLYAKPHDVSIGTLSGDIRITGTLRHPGFEALDEKTLLQAGLSALLSSISGPLGLLPFVQTGGEPDAPCAQLLADAKETNPRVAPAAKMAPKKG